MLRVCSVCRESTLEEDMNACSNCCKSVCKVCEHTYSATCTGVFHDGKCKKTGCLNCLRWLNTSKANFRCRKHRVFIEKDVQEMSSEEEYEYRYTQRAREGLCAIRETTYKAVDGEFAQCSGIACTTIRVPSHNEKGWKKCTLCDYVKCPKHAIYGVWCAHSVESHWVCLACRVHIVENCCIRCFAEEEDK